MRKGEGEGEEEEPCIHSQYQWFKDHILSECANVV